MNLPTLHFCVNQANFISSSTPQAAQYVQLLAKSKSKQTLARPAYNTTFEKLSQQSQQKIIKISKVASAPK